MIIVSDILEKILPRTNFESESVRRLGDRVPMGPAKSGLDNPHNLQFDLPGDNRHDPFFSSDMYKKGREASKSAEVGYNRQN